MTQDSSRRADIPSPGWLWVTLLAGPLAWFGHLNISYALVYLTCRPWGVLWLHLVTAAAVATIAVAMGVGWRRRNSQTHARSEMTEVPESGWQLVGILGRLLGLFFLLVTVMAGVASAMVSPCI